MSYRRAAIFGGVAAVASLAGVGLDSAAGAVSTTPSTAPTMRTIIRLQSVARPATLHAATAIVKGRTETILVNAKGLPLYYFRSDTANKSFVSGELARLWPPLLSAKPTGTGTTGKLTALKVASGHQVAYNGHFLYTFVADTPGNVTGQGVSNFFVATPHLKSLGNAHKAPAPVTSAGGAYGY